MRTVSERAKLCPLWFIWLGGLSGFSGWADQADALNKRDKPNKPDKPMTVSRFEDLDCWQEARQLTNQVYEAIRHSPEWQKDLRLCGQIQGSAGSVMANIAEGFARRSNKEFIQFLFIAMSSSAEVQSHLYIAADQGYISKEAFDSIYKQADKTGRMISGLIKYLRTKQTKQTR